MPRRRLLLITTAVLAATALVPASAARRPHTFVVSMKAFAYAPSSVTIRAGDSVRWTYDETVTTLPVGCESLVFQTPAASCPGHSVTSTATTRGRHLFDTGVHRAKGFPFTFRFTRPGPYTYYCTVHGGAHPNNPVTKMNGQVTVQP
jgi:plastocyanin